METKSFVAEILKREVEIPNKPAYIFLGKNAQRTVLTFSDVINLSRKFAARLRGLGVTRGDVVCNTLPTSPERLISHLGTIMAGAIAMVGQICRADGSDFLESLRDGRAKAIIYDPNCPAGAYEIFKKAQTITRHKNLENCSPQTLIPCVVKSNQDKRPSLIEELENSTEMFCEDNGPESVCSYLCTSGTTGNFKLVPYTSKLLVDGYVEFATNLEIYSDSVLFNDKPFGWTVGQPSIVFTVGCTRVTVDESVHRGKDYPRFVTRAIRQEDCSVAVCTPAFLASLFEQTAIEKYDDRHLLKSIGVVGAPTTKTIVKAIGILTESLTVLYGSTETFTLATKTLNRKEQTFTDYLCGPLLAGVDIVVVDSDMKEVTVGNMGEILIKKSMACSGYINNDRANQETFLSCGWIKLGDVGFLNHQGEITVLGRRSNAIMRGDDVIYPGQLEGPLLQCPGLAEVLITGVPDEAKLEEVCALLVRHPQSGKEIDEDYVRKFCQQSLFVIPENPEYDPMPKYFFFVDTLPKLANGKDDRIAARQLALQLLFKDVR